MNNIILTQQKSPKLPEVWGSVFDDFYLASSFSFSFPSFDPPRHLRA